MPEDPDWSGSTLTGASLDIQVTTHVGPVPLPLGTSNPIGTHITYRQPYQLTYIVETHATVVESPEVVHKPCPITTSVTMYWPAGVGLL